MAQDVPKTPGVKKREQELDTFLAQLARARTTAEKKRLEGLVDQASKNLVRQQEVAAERARKGSTPAKPKSANERIRERRKAEKELGIERGGKP